MSEGAVLVTGAGGLIGHAVATLLVEQGREMVALDRLPVPDAPRPVLPHEIGEVHRLHELVRRRRVTHVVHAGGISGPMVAPEQPAKVFSVNVGGLVDILEVARIHGLVCVVWFSSILAYEPRGDAAPVSLRQADSQMTPGGSPSVAGDAGAA